MKSGAKSPADMGTLCESQKIINYIDKPNTDLEHSIGGNELRVSVIDCGSAYYIIRSQSSLRPDLFGPFDLNPQPVLTPPTQSNTSSIDRKVYLDEKTGITFTYPSKLELKVSKDNSINLSHEVVFDNHAGGCDFKGDSELSKMYTDFDLSISIVNGEAKSPYPDTATPYSNGSLKGTSSYMGIEGCGQITYYFPIAGNRTIVVIRPLSALLSDVTGGDIKSKLYAVPGLITNEESESIVNLIFSNWVLPANAKEAYSNFKFTNKAQP